LIDFTILLQLDDNQQFNFCHYIVKDGRRVNMDLDPYRTTCEVCLSDNICAGFEMVAPRTEVWICEKCCKDFSKKIQRKKMGLVINRGSDSTQKGVVKKRRTKNSSFAA
tara:strand:- start:3220 stop:3546 length:327 start_codon:yes stop_codon:yes gene_type:complete